MSAPNSLCSHDALIFRRNSAPATAPAAPNGMYCHAAAKSMPPLKKYETAAVKLSINISATESAWACRIASAAGISGSWRRCSRSSRGTAITPPPLPKNPFISPQRSPSKKRFKKITPDYSLRKPGNYAVIYRMLSCG